MSFLVKFEKYGILKGIWFAVSRIPLLSIRFYYFNKKYEREKRGSNLLSVKFYYFNKKRREKEMI